jgi:hypothetical protein
MWGRQLLDTNVPPLIVPLKVFKKFFFGSNTQDFITTWSAEA